MTQHERQDDARCGDPPHPLAGIHTSRNLRLPQKAALRLASRVIHIASLGNMHVGQAVYTAGSCRGKVVI